jgi:hypothetical protein
MAFPANTTLIFLLIFLICHCVSFAQSKSEETANIAIETKIKNKNRGPLLDSPMSMGDLMLRSKRTPQKDESERKETSTFELNRERYVNN